MRSRLKCSCPFHESTVMTLCINNRPRESVPRSIQTRKREPINNKQNMKTAIPVTAVNSTSSSSEGRELHSTLRTDKMKTEMDAGWKEIDGWKKGLAWSVYSRLRCLFPPVKPTVTPQKSRVFFAGLFCGPSRTTSSGEYSRFRRVATIPSSAEWWAKFLAVTRFGVWLGPTREYQGSGASLV